MVVLFVMLLLRDGPGPTTQLGGAVGTHTRSRKFGLPVPLGFTLVTSYPSSPGVPPVTTGGSYALQGWQKTTSEGHQFHKLGDGEDRGGPFESIKWTFEDFSPTYDFVWGNNFTRRHWSGQVVAKHREVATKLPDLFQGWPATVPDTPVSTLVSLGATAIARTIPTNPVADTAQFLGELREGLPSLPGRALVKERLHPRSAGGEYLNYQFGIRPIIQDFQKYATAVRDSDRILKQLARDSGRNVRRRYDFPPIVSRTVLKQASYPVLSPNIHDGQGVLTTTTTNETETWFEGAYTYHLPPQGSFDRYVSEAHKLFGVRPSLSTLWELSPWSWAADWFANTGDVLHNLSMFQNDSLVLRYGYLMQKTKQKVEYQWEGKFAANISGPSFVSTSQTFTCERKRRIRATPYGFGLQYDGLSTSQQAIIAALGISRWPRRLN